MKTTTIAVFVVLFAAGLRVVGDDAKPAGEIRKVLSTHSTIAQLTAIENRQCRGRTSLCPDRCGHSGEFAEFKILAYLAYEKKGEYGDPKAETFVVQLADNHGTAKLPKPTADAIRALKGGDHLQLDWRHDYVTRTEPGGGSTSSPERVVTLVKPLTKQDADKALLNAPR